MSAFTDEVLQTTTSILRLISPPLTIAATDGNETISNAKSVFTGYRDPNFHKWGADEASDPTPEMTVALYELIQDATFAQMFSSLGVDKGRLCLTQSQIISFVQMHRDYLRTDGFATFFIFKSRGNFFVALVRFGTVRHLWVSVRRFESDDVWLADHLHRVVVLQL